MENWPAGSNVILAAALLVESATEVAVTVTARVAVLLAGAVYSPDADSFPMAGVMDQVTAVLAAPVTCAASCMD